MAYPSVMLVDDEEGFRTVLAKRLAVRGFDPRQASGGLSALSSLAGKPVDVVVLDVKMPDLDGLSTLRRIHETYPETEVILLTGHASTTDGVEGIKAGAFDYLSKPVEIEHLAGKINQAHEKIVRARERREEEAFRALMAERMAAAERLASLGTLAAGVAHEINNPLAIINDAAGWLAALLGTKAPEDMPLRADLEKGLAKIEASVRRARRITHQLLGHARQNNPEIADTDVAELVEEAAHLVDKEARNGKVALEVVLDPDLPMLRTDPGQLRQVLINLATNAIHAAAPKGHVRVQATVAKSGVRIVIEDDGPGVPDDLRDKIFEPFFSTKSAAQGTGLGLFVSRCIVERLGGIITAHRSELGGAAFRVTLPLALESESQETIPAPAMMENLI